MSNPIQGAASSSTTQAETSQKSGQLLTDLQKRVADVFAQNDKMKVEMMETGPRYPADMQHLQINSKMQRSNFGKMWKELEKFAKRWDDQLAEPNRELEAFKNENPDLAALWQ